jgi:hypothetical protein
MPPTKLEDYLATLPQGERKAVEKRARELLREIRSRQCPKCGSEKVCGNTTNPDNFMCRDCKWEWSIGDPLHTKNP